MSRITLSERIKISEFAAGQFGIRRIAQKLNRSPSTISEEIRREGMILNSYDPLKADLNAKLKQGASRRSCKIEGALKECIDLLLLEKRWSPEQICNYLKQKYPSDTSLHICHETVYRYIYQSDMRDLYAKHLRRRRKKRKPRRNIRREGLVKNFISISKRAEEAKNREEPGHWETDLVMGKMNRSAIGTMVDRTTRYTILVPLLEGKTSEAVVQQFHESLLPIPVKLKKSITHDQGSELSRHQQLASLTNMPIYFAHKGCPWERGTNENTNGLVRDFFPKGTDFSNVSTEQLKRVEKLINERPRNILGYATPAEALNWFAQNPNGVLSEFLALKKGQHTKAPSSKSSWMVFVNGICKQFCFKGLNIIAKAFSTKAAA